MGFKCIKIKSQIHPLQEIMKQYRNKLRGCPDCPCNKDTPCSLRDQTYSCISRIIGTAVFTVKKRLPKSYMYFRKVHLHCEEYNRRVSKLPILDWMIADLEAKPCEWQSSHQRRICSTLMSFTDEKGWIFESWTRKAHLHNLSAWRTNLL